MGNKMLAWLIANYVVIMIAYLFARDWARALYFFGAIILSVGVLLM